MYLILTKIMFSTFYKPENKGCVQVKEMFNMSSVNTLFIILYYTIIMNNIVSIKVVTILNIQTRYFLLEPLIECIVDKNHKIWMTCTIRGNYLTWIKVCSLVSSTSKIDAILPIHTVLSQAIIKYFMILWKPWQETC